MLRLHNTLQLFYHHHHHSFTTQKGAHTRK